MNTKTIAATPLQVRVNRLELLGRLADDLAHEIKNPLHSMIINLELLKRRITGGQAGEALERTEIVGQEVRRVDSLVEALLLLLRPAEDAEPELELASTLDAMMPVARALARVAGARIDYRPPDFHATVRIRPDAFQHAVLNLLANALDALPPEDGCIALHAAATNAEVQLRIRDNGPGIPADIRDRVGMPGFSTRPGRSGLGLTVARAIIDSAGGRLELEPPARPDSGSTFLLALPRHADGLTPPDVDG